MKAKRVWTVCLAVLTLLALLAGCGKQAQVQSDPSPEPDPEPALFDGSFDLVLKSEYQGDLPEVNFRLATDEDGKTLLFQWWLHRAAQKGGRHNAPGIRKAV